MVAVAVAVAVVAVAEAVKGTGLVLAATPTLDGAQSAINAKLQSLAAAAAAVAVKATVALPPSIPPLPPLLLGNLPRSSLPPRVPLGCSGLETGLALPVEI